MVYGDNIDSTALRQEAKRRARLASQNNPSPASSGDDVKDLDKLYHLRFEDTSNLQQPVPRKSSTLTQGAPYKVDASRFWAVLVGIDAYESNPLQGCVSDALSMKEFLIKKLGVPERRIQCLLGSEKTSRDDPLTPSRANIVDMIYSLIDNPEIQRNDNVVIYYAGHGSSYYCSEQIPAASESKDCCSSDACPIEALCPIDRDTMDNDGHPIPDISDRELNALFTQISRTKGHKITFIADCCHAGSVSRDAVSQPGVRTMFPTLHSGFNDMLLAAHERLIHLSGYKSVLSEDWQPDMSSHVVLAACQDWQTARETRVGGKCGGNFTRQLIRALSSGTWKKETTYIRLMDCLNHSHSQTPVVAGEHKDECLWYQDAAT
ncbi:caspase domain-containing protein [Desarmillaria tabescens]|uniref:Caspase domain-containing protein n=1 Tax=Armillaria tabescens TaxID=1929756 RepID=A0AA39J121_ARMTA|nr:caspase domain-containing protein [Desarmillaria tabescens]KAK0433302.1 caspase domain-containing protein [Desarmillaria tabescens]